MNKACECCFYDSEEYKTVIAKHQWIEESQKQLNEKKAKLQKKMQAYIAISAGLLLLMIPLCTILTIQTDYLFILYIIPIITTTLFIVIFSVYKRKECEYVDETISLYLALRKAFEKEGFKF